MRLQPVIRASAELAAFVSRRVAGGAATGRSAEWMADRLRYTAGVLDGLAYRARGRAPDPDVGDEVLVERVRTALGPVRKRRDLPRVNVMAERGVVLLHGELSSYQDLDAVLTTVRRVSGVRGVRPHLHVGLHAGSTRPSQGRASPDPSPALSRLRTAARDAGVASTLSAPTSAAVVRALLDRLPEAERAHVRAHLPADVRDVVDAAGAPGGAHEARSVDEFGAAVRAAVPGLSRAAAQDASVAVLVALRALVPEETGDVAAVLPEELRRLWQRAETGRNPR